MPPNYKFGFEANFLYKADGHLVRIESRPRQGTHSFALENTDFGLGGDLLAFGDRHGKFSPPHFPFVLCETQPEAFVVLRSRPEEGEFVKSGVPAGESAGG